MREEPQSPPSQADRSPEALVTNFIWGYRFSQAIYVAARLSVFDVLHGGPMAAPAIASEVGADADALRRVLSALTTIGILVEDEQGRFAATPFGDMLRSDHPQSQRDVALMLCGPVQWHAWGALYDAVKTGEPAFERVYGEPYFDYLGRRPEDAALFNSAMSRNSIRALSAILDAYDFLGFDKVADVGGGKGTLLRGILERYPRLRGVLCDLPSVIAQADDLRASPVGERCDFVAIDMFESVPPGSDAYILKNILHDWSDEHCVRILRNCRDAMPPSGKVLVIDRLVKPPNQPDPAKWLDLHMLVLLTGRERTVDEFGDLFARAGLRLAGTYPAGALSIVEGVPA